MNRKFLKFTKATKITSLVLVISMIASLSIYLASAANDKDYRLGVFTKDDVTYKDVNAENYKYKHSGNDDDFYSKGDSYNRIDYHNHPIGFWGSTFVEDAFRIQLVENESIEVTAGLFYKDLSGNSKGFETKSLDGMTITWKTSAPEYIFKLEPSEDGRTCKITALDSSVLEAGIISEAFNTVIEKLPTEKESVAENIKNLFLASSPEKIDVDGLIALMSKLAELDIKDENGNSIVNETEKGIYLLLAETLEEIKRDKQIGISRGITVEATYIDENTGKIKSNDITNIAIDIKKSTLPKIKTNIYGVYNEEGKEVSSEADFKEVKKGSSYTLEAKTMPLRMAFDTTWSVKTNTSKSQIEILDDGKAKITFMNEGKVTLVASPDCSETFETINAVMNIINGISESALEKEWVEELILEVLGIEDVAYRDLFKILIKIYLEFLNVSEMFRGVISDALIKISNVLLRIVASERITFNVTG